MKMWCVWLRILCVSAVGATSSRNVPIQTVLNTWIRKTKCFHELQITEKINSPLKNWDWGAKGQDNGGLITKPLWSLRVDGRKRRFSNTMMPYAIQRMYFHCFSVFVRSETFRIRQVWTGEKHLRFQKSPDTWTGSLRTADVSPRSSPLRDVPRNDSQRRWARRNVCRSQASEQDTVNGKYCTCLEPRNEDPGY